SVGWPIASSSAVRGLDRRRHVWRRTTASSWRHSRLPGEAAPELSIVSEDRVPTEVMRLAERRAEARRRGDFTEADDLRDAIRRAGFEVTDSPSGSTVVRRAAFGGEPGPEPEPVRPEDVPSLLDQPASCDVTIHWLVEGWPQDASRGITSFRAFDGGRSSQHVVVELIDERPDWPPEVHRVRVAPSGGWA